MKIAAIQMKCENNAKINLEKAINYTKKAIKEGAKLICYQELFNTIFFPCDINEEYYDKYMNISPKVISTLKKIAREGKVWLAPAMCEIDENENGRYYNSVFLINPKGDFFSAYRKIYIPYRKKNVEKYYFVPGNIGVKVYQIENVKVAFNICYDRHFPELARIAALKGAHILIIPSSSKSDLGRYNSWEAEIISRSIENVFYVMGINRCKKENDVNYFGNTICVDPFGATVSKLNDSEGILYADINPNIVMDARIDYAHLRDLRKDILYDLYKLV